MKPSDYFDLPVESQHGFTAQPVGLWTGGLILASFDDEGHPQLIVEYNPTVNNENSTSISKILETNGLLLVTREILINGTKRSCAVLKAKHENNSKQFITLSDHFVSQLSNEMAKTGALIEIEKSLKKWIEFFRPKLSQTSREKILGLVGELLALRDWLDVSNLSCSNWRGPIGGLHDFVGQNDSLEVKVSGSRKGPLVHKVSDIDQLVPNVKGDLKVLSFRIALGGNLEFSIHELVAETTQNPMFQTPGGQEYLTSALQAAGYNLGLEHDLSRYEVIEQGLYLVGQGFPTMQVQRSGLDSRIVDVTYSLDFSALSDFKMSDSPSKLTLQ